MYILEIINFLCILLNKNSKYTYETQDISMDAFELTYLLASMHWGLWGATCQFEVLVNVSRKAQYKDAYKRTIEMLQFACFFKGNCCLQVNKNF